MTHWSAEPGDPASLSHCQPVASSHAGATPYQRHRFIGRWGPRHILTTMSRLQSTQIVSHQLALHHSVFFRARLHPCRHFTTKMANELKIDSRLRLNDGTEIPRLGLGVYLAKGEQGVTAIKTALELGYRCAAGLCLFVVSSSTADPSPFHLTDTSTLRAGTRTKRRLARHSRRPRSRAKKSGSPRRSGTTTSPTALLLSRTRCRRSADRLTSCCSTLQVRSLLSFI